MSEEMTARKSQSKALRQNQSDAQKMARTRQNQAYWDSINYQNNIQSQLDNGGLQSQDPGLSIQF
jgi:hypothetical protein